MIKKTAILFIAVILAGLLVACTSVPTTTPTVPPTPTPLPDAKSIATQAAEKLKTVNSLRFLVDIKQGEVTIIPGINFKRADGDYLKPEKYQAKLRVSTAVGQVEAETIGIQGEQWLLIRALSQAWSKLPADVGFRASVLFDDVGGVGAVARNAKDLKIASNSETIDGVECWKLSGVSTGTEIAPLTANTIKQGDIAIEAWIGKSDNLFRQVTLKELGVDPAKAANWQLNFSKYDQAVTINRPPGT
jgi:hypothetical protein